jgi:hypothetical protein
MLLVVLLLLPLSLPMCDSEFDHGGGGGGCGGPAVAAVAAVEAVEDNLLAKAAGNKSVDGRMTACDDKIGRRTTTHNNHPTNGGAAEAQQRDVDSSLAAARRRWQRGGSSAAAAAVVAVRRRTSAAAWRCPGRFAVIGFNYLSRYEKLVSRWMIGFDKKIMRD